ncbi:MAG TPA: hypothetical protein VEC36_07585 [Patescibacteria group bacterium]|nr:hypothetical protein [Patescibacteria group bacterium]
MKIILFCFVAILLLCNVAFAQDIERENRLAFVKEILNEPFNASEIIDTSIYYNKYNRTSGGLEDRKLDDTSICMTLYPVTSPLKFLVVEDTIYEDFIDSPFYLGIKKYHK